MKTRRSHWLIKRLGLALAVATVVAPAAQAMPLDVTHRDVASASRTRLYADDLRAPLTTPAAVQQTRRYADDLRAPVPTAPVSQRVRRYADDVITPQPTVDVRLVTGHPSNTFDWSDAGLGAVGAFGLMLLGGAALVGVRHTRRGRLAAA